MLNRGASSTPFAVLLQVSGIDTLGALHSRGGPVILAKAGGTAGRAYHAGNRGRPDQA
jgi:hypothetical protein